jgi:hypothetical protein
MLLALPAHNMNTTTPHMKVGPSMWGPPSYEELLCLYCEFIAQQSILLLVILVKIYNCVR